MLISDLTRQYHNQKATSKKEVVTAKNIGKLMASVRGLTAGNIFEGTVNSIKNGQVVIGLSDGRLLSARLDTTMQLVQGQSMFFQVKSNDGNTVAIAPYMVDGEGVNLTLMNALKAANLPIEDRFLNMANTMMKEHMPIDKNSMTQMARIVMANPDMNVQTLVQMKKLNIPINTESVSQFENYMDDKSAIHLSMERLINEVSTTLSDKTFSLEQMKAFNSELLLILEDGIENDIKISAIQNNFSVQQQNLMSSDLTATNQLSDTKVLLNSDNIGNIYQTESGVSNNENLALHNKEGVVLQENDKIFTKTIAQSANGLEETLTEQLEIGDISNRDNVISKELV
ncbi:MAG: hypothetical protein IKJ01_01650, partial [Lachnospiraceae bacterium]|nr:hypothetical protein [Lachnospiraceae bacterium]